jgi:hypothetical protein
VAVYLNEKQQYFSYIEAISFIGEGNQGAWRKLPTSRKSLTIFKLYDISIGHIFVFINP